MPKLTEVISDLEYLDIVNEAGLPTGETIERSVAHRDGVLHRTAHVWVVRKNADSYDVLLQKRSMEKESFPGFYDTSSAGHIPAGDEPVESALRELQEELGIKATPPELHYALHQACRIIRMELKGFHPRGQMLTGVPVGVCPLLFCLFIFTE